MLKVMISYNYNKFDSNMASRLIIIIFIFNIHHVTLLFHHHEYLHAYNNNNYFFVLIFRDIFELAHISFNC